MLVALSLSAILVTIPIALVTIYAWTEMREKKASGRTDVKCDVCGKVCTWHRRHFAELYERIVLKDEDLNVVCSGCGASLTHCFVNTKEFSEAANRHHRLQEAKKLAQERSDVAHEYIKELRALSREARR